MVVKAYPQKTISAAPNVGASIFIRGVLKMFSFFLFFGGTDKI